MVVAPGGAVATGRLHAFQIRAAKLGEMAGVRIRHRGQAPTQRWRVKLRGVGAALLQKLSVHVLPGLINLGATAGLLSQLSFALFPSRVGGG